MVGQGQTLSGSPNVIANGSAGSGINWQISRPGQNSTVLSHELGHVGNYNSPSPFPGQPYHSSDPNDVMYPTNLPNATGVDKCYCQSIAKLAK